MLYSKHIIQYVLYFKHKIQILGVCGRGDTIHIQQYSTPNNKQADNIMCCLVNAYQVVIYKIGKGGRTFFTTTVNVIQLVCRARRVWVWHTYLSPYQ